jgi:predicted dinucleotide-utilizing enzyme
MLTFGRRIMLSADDSLAFVIKTTAFKFSEMYGRITEQIKWPGVANTVSVTFPWTAAVIDSLRKKFVPNQVLANTFTRLGIPSGAFIDTVRAIYEISSVTHPAVKCSDSAVLTHVMRDSLYHWPIDITNVVNNYPDSVNVKVALIIPVGTPIKVINDLFDATDPAYFQYMGRMIIHQLVDISFP